MVVKGAKRRGLLFHTEEQIAKIDRSIQRFGFFVAVLVDGDGAARRFPKSMWARHPNPGARSSARVTRALSHYIGIHF
jgi:hypothetical protein